MKVENNIALTEHYVLRCVMLNYGDCVDLLFLVYQPNQNPNQPGNYQTYKIPHWISVEESTDSERWITDNLKDANRHFNKLIRKANKCYADYN